MVLAARLATNMRPAQLHGARARPLPRGARTICSAGGNKGSADNYEPLEKAIQVLNRLITLGGKAGWAKGHTAEQAAAAPERWVTFGSAYSARVAIEEDSLQGAGPARQRLRDYLALPADQYSLLDPDWISREASGGFLVSVPLQDLVGIALRPQLSITSRPSPRSGAVTLVGTKASLGAPDVDQAFRLTCVTVLSERPERHLPRIRRPTHLPGRPVYRLRRWAARARGGRVPPEPTVLQGREPTPRAATAVLERPVAELEASRLVVGSAECLSSTFGDLPPDGREVYFTHDDEDATGHGEEHEDEVQDHEEARATSTEAAAPEAPAAGAARDSGAARDLDTQLHCRTEVTMAIRVPAALMAVPNPILGYTGSVLLRAVLSAALPNFVELLASDFRTWATSLARRDLESRVGGLFTLPPATGGAGPPSRGDGV